MSTGVELPREWGHLSGLTIEEMRQAIKDHLQEIGYEAASYQFIEDEMILTERRDPMMFIGVNVGKKISQVHHVGDNRVVTYFEPKTDIEDVAVLSNN